MIDEITFLKDLGEKRLISEIILPLINPCGDKMLAGDDCAVIKCSSNQYVCFSTDRVPSDLISFKLGIIDYQELGYYLAVLNISDIAASGATPIGLLLNFAFPGNFDLKNFKKIFQGVKKACEHYDCKILGGDLSNSIEMNLTATSVGLCNNYEPLYRIGCKVGDIVFCSDYLGLTPTAFIYFLKAKPQGLFLSQSEEKILKEQFNKPKARVMLSKLLLKTNKNNTITCMDNTDGVYQSFIEICHLNNISMELDMTKIPIHSISYKLAEMLKMDIEDVIFAAGADFQLLGTIDKSISDSTMRNLKKEKIVEIGTVVKSNENNSVYLNVKNQRKKLNIPGWNYYSN